MVGRNPDDLSALTDQPRMTKQAGEKDRPGTITCCARTGITRKPIGNRPLCTEVRTLQTLAYVCKCFFALQHFTCHASAALCCIQPARFRVSGRQTVREHDRRACRHSWARSPRLPDDLMNSLTDAFDFDAGPRRTDVKPDKLPPLENNRLFEITLEPEQGRLSVVRPAPSFSSAGLSR